MLFVALPLPQDFKTATADKSLSVVDFYATWCGPCKAVAPKLAALAAETTSVKFYKMDVDEVEDVAEAEGVNALPTFKLYKDGKCVATSQGANIEAIKANIAKFA